MKLIGGRLQIDSTAHGTTVRVVTPLGGQQALAATGSTN
jgi:signal transduction histidine kinase